MARKNYSDEFRRQAVDLYESTPGATVRSIAEDLGIVRGTLRQWLEVHGTGKKTATDGTLIPSPLKPTSVPSPGSPGSVSDRVVETPERRIARLEGRVVELSRSRPPSSRPSGRSFARRPSISPGRRTGEPLPVRRRPIHHLPPPRRGEAAV